MILPTAPSTDNLRKVTQRIAKEHGWLLTNQFKIGGPVGSALADWIETGRLGADGS